MSRDGSSSTRIQAPRPSSCTKGPRNLVHFRRRPWTARVRAASHAGRALQLGRAPGRSTCAPHNTASLICLFCAVPEYESDEGTHILSIECHLLHQCEPFTGAGPVADMATTAAPKRRPKMFNNTKATGNKTSACSVPSCLCACAPASRVSAFLCVPVRVCVRARLRAK